MVDLEKELLADLDSSSDEEVEYDEEGLDEHKRSGEFNGDYSQPSDRDDITSFEEKLGEVLKLSMVNESFEKSLSKIDIENTDNLAQYSKVFPLIDDLNAYVSNFSKEDSDYYELISSVNKEDTSEEYRFILSINELTLLINNEISMYHSVLKVQYQIVFPELETLILNPIDYSKIILLIRQDLIGIKSYEEQLKDIVSNEKVLLLTMAALQLSKKQFRLNDLDMKKIESCCEIILKLSDTLKTLSDFISNKLSKFSPNVTAIIGTLTASQILIASGSLRQLSQTPSCNLPALGVRDMSSQVKIKSRKIRQTGYLYNSELIRYLPEEVIRSVMRIVSGKIILAARIDLSKSCPDGSAGRKFLEEIESKIEKLLKPPENQPDKALPVPIEQKSKKRGGRRYRKMKEMFQMSDLRKAQNKMVFGKEEETVMDGFGEEIGLGMSALATGNGRIGAIKINTNTNARMTKAMTNRLNQNKSADSILGDDLDSIILNNPNKDKEINNEIKSANMDKNESNKWFRGMSKRQMMDEGNDSPNKRHHV